MLTKVSVWITRNFCQASRLWPQPQVKTHRLSAQFYSTRKWGERVLSELGRSGREIRTLAQAYSRPDGAPVKMGVGRMRKWLRGKILNRKLCQTPVGRSEARKP